MANAVNPYGDGHAAQRIADAIEHMFELGPRPAPFGLGSLPPQQRRNLQPRAGQTQRPDDSLLRGPEPATWHGSIASAFPSRLGGGDPGRGACAWWPESYLGPGRGDNVLVAYPKAGLGQPLREPQAQR